MGAGFQRSYSSPSTVSPFGNLPYGLAASYGNQFGNPLSLGMGIGDPNNKHYEKFQAGLGQDQGPLASYIQQSQQFLPGVFKQAQDVGTQIATMAPEKFNQYQNQISGFLSQLPNFQQQAGAQSGEAQGLFNRAQEGVNQAFSPVQSNALTSNALRNTLQQTRGAASGRGLLDAGTSQASEENIAQNLYQNAAQNQFGQQQQALAGAGNALGQQQGALGTQAMLGQGGIGAAGAGLDSLSTLAQDLSARFGIPMQALNQVFQSLVSAQSPVLSLLGQVLPQVAQKSHSFGQNAGI